MNNVELIHKVKGLLREKSRYKGEIDMDHSLAGMLNSITYIQFLIACEDAFEIEIEDGELGMTNFSTFQDMVDFLTKKVYQS
ncbi:MAG: phosphopantetheine-binding protein [Christensenellaceae bacterium]|jgi:acyl carrier protein|nr:phosphopantetheine-binding protein [Christensenellaceae bacterium]